MAKEPSKEKDKGDKGDKGDEEKEEGDAPVKLGADADVAAKIVLFVDGAGMTAWMTVLTFFALIGDDVLHAAGTKSADPWFQVLNTIALFFFLGEYLANTVAKADYKWSFFFWLDLIAAVSIAPDIGWIKAAFGALMQTSAQNDGLSAGRAARLARLVRLVRLIRIVKLYSMVSKAKDAEQEERLRAQARAAANAKQAALKRVEASRLGKVLAERTTRKVIVGILLMLFVLPQLQAQVIDQSKEWGLETLFWFGHSDCVTVRARANEVTASMPLAYVPQTLLTAPSVHCHGPRSSDALVWRTGWDAMVYLYAMVQWDRMLVQAPREPHHKLLWLRLPNFAKGGKVEDVRAVHSKLGSWEEQAECTGLILPEACPYRAKEVETVRYLPFECTELDLADTHACDEVAAYARFEIQKDTKYEAEMSIVQTMIVCFILFALSLQFQNDTQRLVIAPIEKMVTIIKQLAEDPLRKPEVLVDPEEEERKKGEETKGGRPPKKGGPQLETSMLETTILKIGALLQVGFGVAGAEVIGKNMSSGDGDLNIMMPGHKVSAIFGWTDVRNFTLATSVLGEEVMIFINTIGNIVQECVHKWHGVMNKNIGDAFVVLWKMPDLEYGDKKGATMRPEAVTRCTETANASVMAFIKVIAESARSYDLWQYSEHEQLKELDPHWSVKLGLSLHVGWAIEGPIGSDFKIDASYLSPAVMCAEMLETLTKLYQTPLIVSEKLYRLLSLRVKERLRLIDVVRLPGFQTPLGLYAFTVNEQSPPVLVENHQIGATIKDEGLHDFDQAAIDKTEVDLLFVVDRDVSALQHGIPEQLIVDFREAITAFLDKGTDRNWAHSKEVLTRILKSVWPKDGPSIALYKYMQAHDFTCPRNWPGYRDITDFELSRLGGAHSADDLDFGDDDEATTPATATTDTTAATSPPRR